MPCTTAGTLHSSLGAVSTFNGTSTLATGRGFICGEQPHSKLSTQPLHLESAEKHGVGPEANGRGISSQLAWLQAAERLAWCQWVCVLVGLLAKLSLSDSEVRRLEANFK